MALKLGTGSASVDVSAVKVGTGSSNVDAIKVMVGTGSDCVQVWPVGVDTHPTVLGTSSGTTGGVATSVTPTAPATTGGTYLLFVATNGLTTPTTSTSGWVKVGQQQSTSDTLAVFAAPGGSSMPSVAFGDSQEFAWQCYRLADATATLTDITLTGASGTSGGGTPAAHSPGVGTRQQLWFVGRVGVEGDNAASAAPAGWHGLRSTNSGAAATDVTLESAFKAANAASINPGGSFTASSGAWATVTVNVPGTTAAERVFVTEISDDFNRSNRNLTDDGYVRCTDGTSSAQAMLINSNHVVRSASSTGNDVTDAYIHPTSLSTVAQWAQLDVGNLRNDAENSDGNITLRANGATSDVSQALFCTFRRDGWRAGVGVLADGTDGPTTLRGDLGSTVYTSGTYRVEIDSSDVLRVFWNGEYAGGGYVPSAPSGTRVGFNCGSYSAAQWIDNFQAGTFT